MLLALFAMPIGFVSNDGLGHSRTFASGEWPLNPNHLLFEPLGAGWQSLWARLAPGRAGVDALKLLSALAGAAAVALFRLRVAPLVPLRGEGGRANYATAWVGLSSAFLRLWVSDEIHMIQMPFVVGLAGEALRLLAVPSWRGGFSRAGVAAGLATLAFISNALLAVSLLSRLSSSGALQAGDGRHTSRPPGSRRLHSWSRFRSSSLQPGERSGSAGRWRAPAGPSRPGAADGRLGSDGALARGESGYGLELEPRGLGEALLRAGYGAASALVDLQPLAAAMRDRERPTAWSAGWLVSRRRRRWRRAVAAACGRVRRRHGAGSGGVSLSAGVAPILGFGVRWSNSDDQFFFQLAPIFGLLAAVSASEPRVARTAGAGGASGAGAGEPRHRRRFGSRSASRARVQLRRRRGSADPLSADGARRAG